MDAFLQRQESLLDLSTNKTVSVNFEYEFGDYILINLNIYVPSQNRKQSGLKISPSIEHDRSYNLVGMIAHQGDELDSGHYVSYLQTKHGWFLCDDTARSSKLVTFASIQQSDYDPYILLYQLGSLELNPKVPVLIGPWRRNNCFMDASMQLLFNADHLMESKLVSGSRLHDLQYIFGNYMSTKTSIFSINYHQLGYRKDIYGNLMGSEEDPSALMCVLVEDVSSFAIKEWKVWPDAHKTCNAYHVLLVDWKYIFDSWPKRPFLNLEMESAKPVAEKVEVNTKNYQALCDMRFHEANLEIFGALPFGMIDCIKF